MLLVSYIFGLEVDIGFVLLRILAATSLWTMKWMMRPWWFDVESSEIVYLITESKQHASSGLFTNGQAAGLQGYHILLGFVF